MQRSQIKMQSHKNSICPWFICNKLLFCMCEPSQNFLTSSKLLSLLIVSAGLITYFSKLGSVSDKKVYFLEMLAVALRIIVESFCFSCV